MSGSSDYLDRLKNIREKYGCSQPKTNSNYPSDQYPLVDKASLLDRQLGYERTPYTRAESFGVDKMKIVDPHIPSASGNYTGKGFEYVGARPMSNAGLGQHTRRSDRERQIEQIRENYAASRKKVIEDYSAKSYARDFSKQTPKDYLKSEKDYDYLRSDKDYLKSDKDYLRDYTKLARDDLPVAATKIDLLNRGDQSVSPIKRMSDYEDKKSYRQKQTETSQNFWRQRQAKLSQFTANRLNEANTRSSILKDDKTLIEQRLHHVKRSGMYPQTSKYADIPSVSIGRMDMENKPDGYSVSNIDRIQQRIQSILGKRS